MGGTKTAVAVVEHDGRVLVDRRWPTPSRMSPSEAVEQFAERWREVHAAAGYPRIAGLGLSVPGPVDPAGTILHRVFDWPAWHDVPLAALLSRHLGLPVRMDNDVNCCAIAETRWGAAAGSAHHVWLQVSTGVGGAIVINGNLYRGHRGMAGEIGHLTVKPNGRRCTCGRRGCVETLVSGPAIVRRYRNAGGIAKQAEEVFRAAELGDLRAQRLLISVGETLGGVVATIVNLLDPSLIVLGGGVMTSFGPYLDTVRRSAEGHIPERNGEGSGPLLCRTALGDRAALLGAAALIADNGGTR